MKVAKICVATIGGAFFVRSNWGALFYFTFGGYLTMHWFLLGILVFVGIWIYIAKKRQEKIIVFASMLNKARNTQANRNGYLFLRIVN